MTPEEFIQFAGSVAVRFPQSEAARRSAVSRAYYGAYHSAVHFLRDLGFSVSKEHPDASRHLQNSKLDIGVEAGQLLRDLYEHRRNADYQLDSIVFTSEFARLCVEDAEQIASVLRQILTDETQRATMIAAMSEWRRLARR